MLQHNKTGSPSCKCKMKVDTKSVRFHFLLYNKEKGGNKMGKQRKYTPEFKIKCVKEVLEGKKSEWKIAREYEISRSSIQQWIEHYQTHGEEYFYEEHRGRTSGNPYAALHTKKNLSELERLELENLKLRIENERLKKGYMVKGVGASKEFVTFKDKNTKS